MDSSNREESPHTLFRTFAVAALAVLAMVLYLASNGLSLESKAHAQSLPVASLVSVSPNPVSEGTRLRVKVRLVPESGAPNDPVHGGIIVFDSYSGPPADELIAWAFRGGKTETTLSHLVCYDGAATSGRTIRIVMISNMGNTPVSVEGL